MGRHFGAPTPNTLPRSPRRQARSAHMATAAAAATLSESTPPAIGIRTVRSAPPRVRRASPSPSVPRTSARRSGGSAASCVEGDRVLCEGQGGNREPGVLQRRDPARPRLDPRPGHLEDGAHRDADRPAVEGVRAPRGHEDRVDPQSGAAAERRPHVGVVDDVLEDEHPPRIGDDGRHGRQVAVAASRPARHGGGGTRSAPPSPRTRRRTPAPRRARRPPRRRRDRSASARP